MTATSFTTTILVDKNPAEVFDAINKVKDWWQGSVTGNTSHVGDEFEYRMKTFHLSRQKIIEMQPNKKIVWLVTDSNLDSFEDKTEWTGTKIIFEITGAGNKTELRFTHEGLVPDFQCYGSCSGAWGRLVQESLFSLITTGKGKNVFG